MKLFVSSHVKQVTFITKQTGYINTQISDTLIKYKNNHHKN